MSGQPRSTYETSCGLFLRLLGLVYLVAIVSLWTQVDGLVGSHGILPLERSRAVDPRLALLETSVILCILRKTNLGRARMDP